MGLIHIDLFTTLDGVAQAPGGPGEDIEGGFGFGGWQASLLDDLVGEQVGAGMQGLDALLLGRRTYDIFAAYWPDQEQGVARVSLDSSTSFRSTSRHGALRRSTGRTPRCSAPTSCRRSLGCANVTPTCT